MDWDLKARVIAAKAFCLGRDICQRQAIATAETKIRQAIAILDADQTVEGRLRLMFYNLLAAELQREGDPIPYRLAAMAIRDCLHMKNIPDPFPIYMAIVDAATQPMTTANVGDFIPTTNWSHDNRQESPLVVSQSRLSNHRFVIEKSGLSNRLTPTLQSFLFETELDSILRHHGIVIS